MGGAKCEAGEKRKRQVGKVEDKDWDRGERAGTDRMSSCPLLALPTWCDSYQAGVSACVFTSADQLRVCPHIIVLVNMFFQAQVELFIT